jgi:hypothetical protein
METDKSIIIIGLLYYFYFYGIPPKISNYFFKLYVDYAQFFVIFNRLFQNNYEITIDLNTEEIKKEEIQPKKYEDKYLDDIRSLNKDWVFTEDEILQIPHLKESFLNVYIENMNNRIEEITNEIANIEKIINKDNDDIKYVEDFDDDGNELNHPTLEDRINQIKNLQEEYNNLKNQVGTENGLDNLINKSNEHANKFIIDKRLDKLKNCYVMEKTPIGNVLMIYDKEQAKFKYYSDSTIPYRYLEVVGRKYVKTFNCRPIFVDMEEELKLFEEKWEKEQQNKKEEQQNKKEEEKLITAEESNNQIKKKDVFAKFKSYNKDGGSKISMAPPPKNSISSKTISENKENEKIILKEKANCYSYFGKLSNFNFLQKVEKKVFNKKLGFTFADFKKMNNQ